MSLDEFNKPTSVFYFDFDFDLEIQQTDRHLYLDCVEFSFKGLLRVFEPELPNIRSPDFNFPRPEKTNDKTKNILLQSTNSAGLIHMCFRHCQRTICIKVRFKNLYTKF